MDGMVVRVLAIGDPAVYGYLEPGLGVLDAFRTRTGCQTSFDIKSWTDYVPTLFDMALDRENAPYDVVMVAGHMWADRLVRGGWLEPLDAYPALTSAAYDPGGVHPAIVERTMVAGVRYLAPAFTVSHVVYARHEAELQPDPDGVVSVRSVREHAIARNLALAVKASPAEILLDWLPYLWEYGGELLSEEGEPRFDTPEGRAALHHYISLRDLQVPNFEPYGNEEIALALGRGKASIGITWGSQAGLVLGGPTGATVPFTFATPQQPFSVAWSFGIISASPNREMAAELIAELTRPETDRLIAPYAGAPVRSTTMSDPVIRQQCPWMSAQEESVRRARRLPALSNLNDLMSPLYQNLAGAWWDKEDPDTQLRHAADEIRRLLASS
jgi:multiple sugar transport system substrate-binding protein